MKDINFLKKESIVESLSKKKGNKDLIANVLLISTVAVVGIYFICFGVNWFYGIRIGQLNDEIQQYGEVVTLQATASRCKENINTIRQLVDSQSNKRYISDTIKIIGEKCLPDVIIKDYAIDEGGNLKIAGDGVTKEGVIQFAEVLRTSGYFSKVQLNNVGAVSSGKGEELIDLTTRYAFTIDLEQ